MLALLFDTETSGLIKNSLMPLETQPRVIEYFGHIVDTDTGEIIRELEFICNPHTKIDKKITEITGLTNDDLKDKQSFSAYEGEIRSIIGEAQAVIAHNLSYDYALIQAELLRCGTIDKVRWPMIRICTVEQTEWYNGYRLSLSALHEHLFHAPFPNAHRAMNDVMALTRCVLEMFRRGDL